MKQEKKKDYEELFLNLYNIANSEIELLKDYYKLSCNNLKEKRLSVERKYSIGEKINTLLDKIVNKQTFEINEEVLSEYNKLVLFADVKFSDVIKNIKTDKEKKKVYFSIDEKYKNNNEINPNVASKKFSEIKQYEQILSRSILSDIIVTFESVLSKLLNILTLKNPFSYLENEMIPLANFFLD